MRAGGFSVFERELPFTFFCPLRELWGWRPDHQAWAARAQNLGGVAPRPQPFCLWGAAFFREKEVGGRELVVSF